ncbi:MAG TPA: hypothetical protein VE326_10105 [Candidatus Binatia bacterium]|nr:hypothetical protein [Candidatus Binatia bacterium]
MRSAVRHRSLQGAAFLTLLAMAALATPRADAAPRGRAPAVTAPARDHSRDIGAERPFATPFGTPAALLPKTPALPGAGAALPPRMIDSYPRDGDNHVAANATLYFVFDQATSKRGIFSVADLDSLNGVLLNLNTPTWSALGDTVFIKPTQPMTLGHQHGMRVNLIVGPPPDSATAGDQPIVYFRTFPPAVVKRISQPTSLTLVPGEPTPVTTTFQETSGNAVNLTSAHIEIWPTADALGAPALDVTVPVAFVIPREGIATVSVPVTVPGDVARQSPDGRLALRITYLGVDETQVPATLDAFNGPVTVALTPALAGNAVIRSAVLEWPLPGAVFGAGDTLKPRAVVIGDGTGYFRSVFYLDGEAVAFEEGFMESGRPVVVETRGSIPTRRFGEHRLQFVVESPQTVAAQPITFLSAPPANGLTPRGPAPPAALPDTSRVSLQSTWLADGRSEFRDEGSAVTGWASFRGHYGLSATKSLEARVTSRVRFDDVQNGSASPEQFLARYQSTHAAVEWGDLAPALASGAPLLASPVPRRASQAMLTSPTLGTFEGYMALESHPRSAGGPLRDARSDLYAARLTRVLLPDRLRASLYGGYTHEDATPGGAETATHARVIYGGSASLILARWSLLADIASVRHRTIAGVETGRTRTGARGEITGTVARFQARAEAFRYQPSLATALNPYAISDRKGFAVDLARPVLRWKAFANYRRERPEDASSGAPPVTAERMSAGATFSLNQDSWVSPSIIRIRQTGSQTDFTQTRLATEFTASEPMGGRTTARFDVGTFDDEKGVNVKRRVLAGSVVSMRRHPGRVTSTISGGIERDENRDLHLRDMTIQGTLEVRWEASPSRLLVTPFLSYISRDYELQGRSEDRAGGRLQISFLRVPGLGDAALSIQGRVERIWRLIPEGTHDTDEAVEVSLGKRISILP